MELKLKMRKSFLVISFVHLLLYMSIGLDIIVLRQATVFVYLSFIPGFVLLKILRPKETSVVDTILFSVGLSIAFTMFVGLLINEFYPIVGVSSPLTTIPLLITISFLTFALFLVSYGRGLSEDLSSWKGNFPNSKVVLTRSAILVLPALLGVIGALYVNVPLLLLMIIAAAALYALSAFSTKFVPYELYPLAIFAISIALTTQVLLTSKYIMGFDANLEYYVFKLTAIGGYWRLLPVGSAPLVTLNYDAMLSVTILPTIYTALMNISGEIVFKTFYPFVFSLVPVTLYQIYRGQIGNPASILSAFFFVSGSMVFYGFEPLSLNRQIVGELFLVLSILVLLDKKISTGKRRLLLIAFGAALVVSHYSLMYLYLALGISIYAISTIRKYSDKMPDATIVLSLLAMAFSWYNYSEAPFVSLDQFFYRIYSRFSRDVTSSAARLGWLSGSHPAFGSTTNSAGSINWALFYAMHFFIVIGILGLLLKSKRWTLNPKYRILSILSGVILFSCLIVPNVAPSLNFTRFYAVTLLFLAPCFVLGGETLVGISVNILKKATNRRFLINTHRISTILLVTMLIGYFFSQSGFVNLVTGAAPLSPSLDFNRARTSRILEIEIGFHSVYISEYDVLSAVWLSKNMITESTVYADFRSRSNVLTSYGLIPSGQMLGLTNKTIIEQNAFIYLGELNVVDRLITTGVKPFNISEISPLLDENNLIYSNGNSQIWHACSISQVDG